LGGLTTCLAGRSASATASNADLIVSPDPIGPRIKRGGIAAGLIEFSTPPPTSSERPYALLNFLYHAGDGSGRLFANDSRGKLWLIEGKTGAARLFLDLHQARGGMFLPGSPQMGLRSFAFHPDFAREGQPGYRKLYTVSTETAASRPGDVRVFEGPFVTMFHDVVAEWSVDAGDPFQVEPASRREILRIAQFKRDHNTDQLMFDPNAQPGSPDYGKLFIGVGDGGNVPEHPDPYDQAQDPGRALGKLLRVDPLKQADGAQYGIPADNPFVGRRGYLPEIWALGLRHPQNLSFDRGGAGTFLITDIGQAYIEEVNLGIKGANYGWPLREGTFATDRLDQMTLYALPDDDPQNGFTYPVAQYDRDEANGGKMAVAGGFVYRGTAIPALAGHYVFGDIVTGRVFHVPVSELRLGTQATIEELSLLSDGEPVTLKMLVGGSKGRVDLRFGQDEAGEIYLLTKQDGKIRKLGTA
jgi:glucose/arabinose dehydrogenase